MVALPSFCYGDPSNVIDRLRTIESKEKARKERNTKRLRSIPIDEFTEDELSVIPKEWLTHEK